MGGNHSIIPTMRITVIATVPSAVWLRPAAETAPVRGILTTAPPRPTGQLFVVRHYGARLSLQESDVVSAPAATSACAMSSRPIWSAIERQVIQRRVSSS